MRVFVGLLFIVTLLGVALCQDNDQENYRGSQQSRSRYGSRYGYGGPSYRRGGGHQRGSRYRQGGHYHDGYRHKKVFCPKLSNPANGNVTVSGRYPGDKAVYKCSVGYVLVGLDIRKCLSDGKWSGEAPICKRIDCGPLPDIANGKVDIAPDTRLGSTATYSCNAGFNIVGSATRQCQASGQWSGQEPSCEPVDCGPLPNLPNGWIHISPDTLLGAVAIHKCKLGYVLHGNERRYCQEDGNWDGTVPICQPIDCGPQPTPDPNGKIESTQGTSLGDQTTYVCNDGYFLEGTKKIYCQNDGKYSDDAPKCKRIDCGDLSDIPNGNVVIAPDTSLGSTATYSCDAGFNLVGEDTRTCQTNGEWSGEEPSCAPVNCGDLSDPGNGWVHISPDTLLGAVAIYRCKLGYELSGDERRHCQTDGTWGPSPAPTCQPISCGNPPTPDPNGSVESTGTILRNTATYSCNDGFFLEGTMTIYCQNDGTWSDDAPKCIRIDCGDLSDIPNGNVVIAPDTSLGSTATYSCDAGFNLVGEDTRTCQTNGEWSGEEPSCAPVNCGDLSDPGNGWVHISPDTLLGAVAIYRCKLGYELNGDERRHCQTDGTWGPSPAPTCQPISCGNPPTPDPNGSVESTGTILRNTATYSCNDGFFLEGTMTIYCQNDGTWSDDAPKCIRIDCGDLSDIPNGNVVIAPDTSLGSTATYSCDAGFNLVGEDTRTCQTNGEWSGEEPSCAPVNCGDLSDPGNGWVHISPDTLLGAVAIYRCKLGYELNGDERRHCQTDGTWGPSPAPTCQPISCGNPPTPDPNGSVESTGTILRNTATYSCNDGFFLEGTMTIYCQNDGTWSDDAPKCNPVRCGNPDPADPNGDLNVDRTTLGGKASYSCNAGYNLVGEAVATCQSNGEWSSERPTCEPVDCGILPSPKHGAVFFYPGTTLSSIASFACRRGFRLVGSKVRRCQTNGKWSGEQPVCKKISCPKLEPPKYGKIYVSGNYPGDYAIYDCVYGYKIIGKRRRVCLYTGSWSGSVTDCAKDDSYGGDYGYHSN